MFKESGVSKTSVSDKVCALRKSFTEGEVRLLSRPRKGKMVMTRV